MKLMEIIVHAVDVVLMVIVLVINVIAVITHAEVAMAQGKSADSVISKLIFVFLR